MKDSALTLETPKKARLKHALMNPEAILREISRREAIKCRESFYYFLLHFWPEYSNDEFIPNWHIKYICDQLQEVAERVAKKKPKKHDLIINVPPGSTKTAIICIMFPVWCWTRWYWMRFITLSYAADLALESAEYSREIIRSEKFQLTYPELRIKADKDTKSNFRITKEEKGKIKLGGNRFSTSVGGKCTGYHAHFLLVDDPIDPHKAASEVEIKSTNHWIDQTLPTRKIDKAVTPTAIIQQRLHQDDSTGHTLKKKKKGIFHICIPGEIKNYREKVSPPELVKFYIDDLLDPERMSWEVLEELEQDLGQYGYAGQIGQNPTPPAGGMFKVDNFQVIDTLPSPVNFVNTVRYWDKAGTQGGGAYTSGTKMSKLRNGKYLIHDIKRGQWSSENREAIIRSTAEADGTKVFIYTEQEPGSGGKESAEATVTNLAGFSAYKDRPTGDKVYRADPFSVQVNNGNVLLLRGDWNKDFIEEHRFFPFSKYKDQVDSSSAAFNKLAKRKIAGPVI